MMRVMAITHLSPAPVRQNPTQCDSLYAERAILHVFLLTTKKNDYNAFRISLTVPLAPHACRRQPFQNIYKLEYSCSRFERQILYHEIISRLHVARDVHCHRCSGYGQYVYLSCD